MTPRDVHLLHSKQSKRVLVIDGGNKENQQGGDRQGPQKSDKAAAETGLGLGCNQPFKPLT
jgi:hypothetical protein